MTKLVFIIGAGRSGSTLFMNMLNQHSCVVAPPEHDFLLNSIYKFKDKDELSEKEIRTWVNNLWIRKTEFKELWKLDEKKLLDELLSGDKSYVSVFLNILSHYDSHADGNIVLDKNPFYTEHIDLLKSRFPEAAFICLVRDFRDRYVSILRNKSKVFKNGILRTSIWNRYNLNILKLKQEYPNDTYILKFEDLINESTKTLCDVSDFLNISYEPSMLEYHKLQRMKFSSAGVLNDAINKMHEGSDLPINRGKVGQWKNNLNIEELKELSFFCNETAEVFGYTDLLKLTLTERKEIKKKYRVKLIKGKLLFELKKMSYRLPWWVQKTLAINYRKTLSNKNTGN
jgi:hypothetical protein